MQILPSVAESIVARFAQKCKQNEICYGKVVK